MIPFSQRAFLILAVASVTVVAACDDGGDSSGEGGRNPGSGLAIGGPTPCERLVQQLNEAPCREGDDLEPPATCEGYAALEAQCIVDEIDDYCELAPAEVDAARECVDDAEREMLAEGEMLTSDAHALARATRGLFRAIRSGRGLPSGRPLVDAAQRAVTREGQPPIDADDADWLYVCAQACTGEPAGGSCTFDGCGLGSYEPEGRLEWTEGRVSGAVSMTLSVESPRGATAGETDALDLDLVQVDGALDGKLHQRITVWTESGWTRSLDLALVFDAACASGGTVTVTLEDSQDSEVRVATHTFGSDCF